jgi:hypothetical protein
MGLISVSSTCKRDFTKRLPPYNLLATEISSIRLLKQHCQTASEAYAVSLILLYAYKLQGIDDCL